MKLKIWALLTLSALLTIVAACGAAPETQTIVETVVVTEKEEVVVTATPEPAADAGPIPVSLRLNWTLYGEHAPFFVALEKGFYAEEGLDVEILEGSGSATTVKLIGNGSDDIGYADAGTMMKGVAVGVPVKAVGVFVQQSPMAAIFKADKPIATVDDLKGKNVGVTTGDSLSQIFPAVLSANGLSDSDVNLVALANPAAKETALLEDQIDTFLGYFIDQPARMEVNQGVDMDWITFADMGVNTLSGALFVNQRTIEDNPDMVRKFVAATVRAWDYTAENPDEAAEIFAKYADQFTPELARVEIDGTLSLLHTANSEGKTSGWMALEDWENTRDLLAQYSDLKPEEDANVYFTNEFMPE